MLALNKKEGFAHQAFMDMFDELNTNLKYRCLTDPGVVIGSGSAAKVKLGGTPTYLNNGIFYAASSAEVAFTATTHDIPADADSIQEACYLLCIDASDALTLHMGAISSTDGGALLPEIPAGLTPLGYLRLQVAAGATDFNASTDLLSAGHLTDTFVDLGFLSPRFDAAQ
jgi:hypothetical protein